MDRTSSTSIGVHFAPLTDPRVERTTDHLLVDIVTVALCAVICGAGDWVAVETFGRAKEAWRRTFLALPGGIPSHDTVGRVFARLDPAACLLGVGDTAAGDGGAMAEGGRAWPGRRVPAAARISPP